MTRESSIPPINPDDLSEQADADRVARIWARLEPEVTTMAESRAQRGQLGVWAKVRARRPRTTTWLVAASFAGVFGAGLWIGHSELSGPKRRDLTAPIARTADETLDVFASGSKARTFALPNGGNLTLDAESTVEVAELSDSTMVLSLLRGSASVDGTHIVDGTVSIVAGEARITAPAGGGMAVRRNNNGDLDDVDVTAIGRSIEIDSPAGHRTIASGERARAVPTHTVTVSTLRDPNDPTRPHVTDANPTPRPEVDATAHPLVVARDPEPNASVSPRVDTPPTNDAPDWLVKYQANDWRGAVKSLDESGGAASAIVRARDANELGLLCDLMRQSGNWELAVRAAKRIVDDFPSDPQAAVFAITLGNLYTAHGETELAQKYLALGNKGPLQEDVVCRQLREGVATDPSIVALAQQYMTKYGTSSGAGAAVGQCTDLAESIINDAATDPKSTPAPSASASASAAPSAAPSSAASAGPAVSAAPSAGPKAGPPNPAKTPPRGP